jgi:hypothetical protein
MVSVGNVRNLGAGRYDHGRESIIYLNDRQQQSGGISQRFRHA